jgi:hypothetical protein
MCPLSRKFERVRVSLIERTTKQPNKLMYGGRKDSYDKHSCWCGEGTGENFWSQTKPNIGRKFLWPNKAQQWQKISAAKQRQTTHCCCNLPSLHISLACGFFYKLSSGFSAQHTWTPMLCPKDRHVYSLDELGVKITLNDLWQ